MPTTFNVIPLGQQALIDTIDGNFQAENAAALVGLSIGDVANPLWETVQTFSAGSTGFGAGTPNAYDQDAFRANETFRIDGGADRFFSGTSIYNATITYTDGTTAQISAVIFQDTTGATWLAPEFSANADQAALEAGPIRSLRLDSLSGDTFSGMTGSREAGNFAVCFAGGTLIRTPDGERAVESLKAGDLVETLDHGAQPVRWIGGRTVPAQGAFTPIEIKPGALGGGLPRQRLILSRQHRVLARSRVAERMFGVPEVLLPAHKLLPLRGVREMRGRRKVAYWHFMCDAHEVVFANGAPAETLYLGPQARQALSPEALRELLALFPDLVDRTTPTAARPIPAGPRLARFMTRVRRNGHCLQDSALVGA